MRIIGCGNPDRGDDGAGIQVAKRLRSLGVSAEIHTGEPLELLDRWSLDDNVILVDAVVTGAAAGTVGLWELPPARFPRNTGVSSHGFDVAQAIELARVLQRLPARLRIYGIEGGQFAVGTAICPEVEQAIESVVREIAAKDWDGGELVTSGVDQIR